MAGEAGDNLYSKPKRRVKENFKKQVWEELPGDFYHIRQGKVVIYDKVNKEVVLVVRFNPFDTMSMDEKKELNLLTMKLYSIEGAQIHSNGAHRRGNMFALGWRGGNYKKNL